MPTRTFDPLPGGEESILDDEDVFHWETQAPSHPEPSPAEEPEPAIDDPPAADPVDAAPPVADVPVETTGPIVAAPVPAEDARTISASRILEDRPDVLRAFYSEYYGPNNDRHSDAWNQRVGGDTPEDFARYWYARHGKYEGYAQSETTAQDNVSLTQILHDRPDVLRAFYSEYYGPNNDRHSDAWNQRVGGDTPEDFARYWYERYGKWEGYAQTEKAAAENINVEKLLLDRPDVFRAFYTEFYGPNNDRHSSAWVDRVGGDTVQDFAKYWYETYGKRAGYTQTPADQGHAAPSDPDPGPDAPAAEAPPIADPSLDPWNHPALYPDAQKPAEAEVEVAGAPDEGVLSVGRSLSDPELFG